MDWQPIDTAPRDGTAVDLWGINHLTWDKRGTRRVNVSWGPVRDWMGGERDDWQHGLGEDFEPTHWMPLPAPPSDIRPSGPPLTSGDDNRNEDYDLGDD